MVIIILFIIIFSLFAFFVLPIWLWMHYRNQRYQRTHINKQDMYNIEELTEQAQRINQRISVIEAILDEDQPGWRERL